MLTAKTEIPSFITEQQHTISTTAQSHSICDVLQLTLCTKIILSLTTVLLFSLLFNTVDMFFIVSSIVGQLVENYSAAVAFI